MGIFIELATGASLLASEAAEGGGWGLDLNILETNLINLAIVNVVVFYFGRKFLGKNLGDRKESIQTAIQEAEARKKTAAAALADQQQKLAQAQAEVQKITAAAAEAAKTASTEILAKAEQDIQRMREVAAQDLSTEQDRIMNELRQRVVALALQRVESELPNRLNDDSQRHLVDRSISLLGGS